MFFLKTVLKVIFFLIVSLSFHFAGNAQNSFKAGASFGVIASQVAGDGYGGFDKAV